MPARAEDITTALARVPAFAELGAAALAALAAVAVPRSFAAGEAVVRAGDASDSCYVVRDGHARAIREHPDGRQITLATFGPGEIFGELAMFDDELRSATVEATEDLRVLAILGSDMRRLMGEHPEIAVKLARRAGPPAARRERAARAPVVPDGPEPRRGRARASSSRRRSQQGGGRARRLDHGDPGRRGQARRLVARVRQPLPRRARARRCDLAGPRAAHGARSGSARRLCLLSTRSPTAASSCAATT